MSIVLKYSKGVYEAKITELEANYTQLQQHLARMESLKSEMFNYWDDENARRAGLILANEIRGVKNAMDRTKDMFVLYKTIINKMTGVDEATEAVLAEAEFLLKGIGL